MNQENSNPSSLKAAEIFNAIHSNGERLTKQRKLLISLIIENPLFTEKEIYYKAIQNGHKVGLATIYRTRKYLKEKYFKNPQN